MFTRHNRPPPFLLALSHIGPRWHMLYQRAPRNLLKVLITDWSLPSVWTASRAKSLTLKRLAANPYMETPVYCREQGFYAVLLLLYTVSI